ncbi:dephospho-CoA kinase [Wenzhouxiangella sp. AB-CW3]|nr:dephospho-CoA kinase [Wenzhouxiangella sp. AB-CW3]
MPLLVVLTGGVASGKSLAADYFAELGAAVIDTDLIAREVVAPGSDGLAEVARVFGPEMIDENGELNRRRLREQVFADDQSRQQLEDMLHPRIERRAREHIAAAGSHHDYIVLVVPLLVETGLFPEADVVVVIDVPEIVQIERLTGRDRIDHQQAKAMLNAQASREQRRAAADEVLDNTGSPDDLHKSVRALHDKLRETARRRRSAGSRPA